MKLFTALTFHLKREMESIYIVGCLQIAKQINSKLDFTFTVKTTPTSMTTTSTTEGATSNKRSRD
jgi:hypothetical protein